MDKSFKHVSSKSINEGLGCLRSLHGAQTGKRIEGGARAPGAPVLPTPMACGISMAREKARRTYS